MLDSLSTYKTDVEVELELEDHFTRCGYNVLISRFIASEKAGCRHYLAECKEHLHAVFEATRADPARCKSYGFSSVLICVDGAC